jgi:hypothetical protein
VIELEKNGTIKYSTSLLVSQLKKLNANQEDVRTILKLCDYAPIGHRVFSIMKTILESNGKIHSPIGFLIKKLKEKV